MKLILKCGEYYEFYKIKYVEDQGNGTIEIKGNFKHRGKYKTITLFRISIVNWTEFSKNVTVTLKPYWCSHCRNLHKSGKIYEYHKKYWGNEDAIPSDKILSYDPKKLRPVAKRQIIRLAYKMNKNKKKDIYIREINRLLISEGVVNGVV